MNKKLGGGYMLGLITLIIADAALESVHKEIWSHPAVKRHAESKGKEPGEILLDRSYHHAAMLRLKNHDRRGRPDLVHLALLEATSTPLYMNGLLRVYIHTIGSLAVEIERGVRIPKSYFRFEGLFEKLIREGEVKSGRRTLIKVWETTFKQLLNFINPSKTIGLSRIGQPKSLEEIAAELSASERPALVVGGFTRGHFTEPTSSHLDRLYSVSRMTLEASVVIARALYEYEKLTGK